MKILAILVLYNIELENSESWLSLSNQDRPLFWFIQNNGNIPISLPTNRNGIVINDSNNGGISAAYRNAISYGSAHNFTHILMVDQDTIFPVNFIIDLITLSNNNRNVECFLPTVISNHKLLSPFSWKFGRGFSLTPPPKLGLTTLKNLSFINSGTFFSTNLLNIIWKPEFNELFLDCIDHIIADNMRYNNIKVYIYKSSVEQNYSNNSGDINSHLCRLETYSKDVKTYGKLSKKLVLSIFWLFIHKIVLFIRFRDWRILK